MTADRSFAAPLTDTSNRQSFTLIFIITWFNYKAGKTGSRPQHDQDHLVQIVGSKDVTCQVFFLWVSARDVSEDKVCRAASVWACLQRGKKKQTKKNGSFLVTVLSSTKFSTEQPIPLLSPVWVKSSHNTNVLSSRPLLLSSDQNRWFSSLNLCKFL